MATARKRQPRAVDQVPAEPAADPVDEPATDPVPEPEPIPAPEPPAEPAAPPAGARFGRRAPAPAGRAEPAYVRATRRLVTPDGGLAHMPGDLVPAQNVDRNGWGDGVKPLDGG